MAGPTEEWLIWDRRFQIGYSCLNQRLRNHEEALKQIAQLDQRLAASSKQLQENSDGLRDRVQQLEQASRQAAQLDAQVQDLTASARSLKDENNVLHDRILQLEQEGTRRDEENRLVHEQLKGKLKVLEGEFTSVAVSMQGMNEIARKERAQRGKEMQQLRSQVEALVSPRPTAGRYA